MLFARLSCVFLLTHDFVIYLLALQTCDNCLNGQCDDRGVCTAGCKSGFTDKYCQHPCQSTCKDGDCKLDVDTGKIRCTEGCVDGYCGLQCKAPCPRDCLKCDPVTCDCTSCDSTRYGDLCQYKCLDKCSGFACDIRGNCLEPCLVGRYGVNCSLTCEIKCRNNEGNCELCGHKISAGTIYTSQNTKSATTSATSPPVTTSTTISLHRSIPSSTATTTTLASHTKVSEPDAIQIFFGVIGTLIFILLLVLVVLKVRTLCKHNVASLRRESNAEVGQGNHCPVNQPEEAYGMSYGRYYEIKEDEMDQEAPVLVDVFQPAVASNNDRDEDVIELETEYSHLSQNITTIAYITPSDGSSENEAVINTGDETV